MQTQDKIILNEYIENDPLSEDNLDKTLETIHRFRLLLPEKTIWLYSGYTFEECLLNTKRREILKNTDVMVDGRYIDSQRDITLKWRGSSNQRVINVKESIKQNELVLYCN